MYSFENIKCSKFTNITVITTYQKLQYLQSKVAPTPFHYNNNNHDPQALRKKLTLNGYKVRL